MCNHERKETHVSDIMTSECNQPALFFDGPDRGLRTISSGRDKHFIAPNLPKEFV